MSLDFETLDLLMRNHPAWRLLRSDHAPLVASFFHRAFVVPNKRAISQAQLAEQLEDTLFALRERLGDEAFPKAALDYLNDWAANERAWLRKFYPADSDEPHFDLTPAAEKAIQWLAGLGERSFVGTESRLLTLFDLLKQIAEGTETDPAARLAELEARRAAIDAEMARIRGGDIPLLDDTGIKDRFQQFVQLARELLTDFREVEHNFRALDREVREKIALWDGGKGALLEDIMGERDAIADSDEGKSFQAFWTFLMSPQRQDDLTRWLDRVLGLPPVAAMRPDRRLRRVHYDWLEAGDHTQRTVAQLSHQLRRFLDDKAWLENRRIMDILRGIESAALAVRDMAPSGPFMEIAEPGARVELPMVRNLFTPPLAVRIESVDLETGDADLDTSALFDRVVVDKRVLDGRIRQALQTRTQISLRELLLEQPLAEGLAELVGYLQLACESRHHIVDEQTRDQIEWRARDGATRRARLPRVIYSGDHYE